MINTRLKKMRRKEMRVRARGRMARTPRTRRLRKVMPMRKKTP